MRAYLWRPTGPSVGFAGRHSPPFTSFVPTPGPLAVPASLSRVLSSFLLPNHAPCSTVCHADFWRHNKGYERIRGGRRALELATDSRGVAPWKGARRTVTSQVEVEPPMGGLWYDSKHAGGGLQPDERHNLAMEVLKIIRPRKIWCGGLMLTKFRM
jgi:hypothetical protein